VYKKLYFFIKVLLIVVDNNNMNNTQNKKLEYLKKVLNPKDYKDLVELNEKLDKIPNTNNLEMLIFYDYK
jgi:hypothetical protein